MIELGLAWLDGTGVAAGDPERPRKGARLREHDVRHPHHRGGDEALPQVQAVDELLRGGRFEASLIREDTSGAVWELMERATGRRFILKSDELAHQAENEVIVSHLHERLGMVWPRARFALAGRNDWAIIEHAEDRPGGRILGKGDQIAGDSFFDVDQDRIGRLATSLTDPSEPLQVLLLDFLCDNVDRFGHNWFVLSEPAAPASTRLVPFDHANCLAGNPDPTEEGVTYERFVADRLASASTLPSFFQAADVLWWVHFAALELGRLNAAEVAATYDRFTRAAAGVVASDWLPPAGVDQDHAQVVRQILWTRLTALRGRRQAHLRFLLGAE
jgi:hypothetical protein